MFWSAVHDADLRSIGNIGNWAGDACHRIAGKTGTYRSEQAFETVERHIATVFK
jgi:hypothetical protein